MPRRKRNQCYRCDEPAYLGGLCREHNAEDTEKKQKREAALKALHFGTVENRTPEDPALRDELSRLRQ